MRRWNKKATLAISIGAIVIIVIAFVVLGLGLVLTKTIFGGAKEKIPEIFAITKLGQEPTAETPLTVPDAIDIKRNSEKELEIGYYNKEVDTHENVEITIDRCQAVTAGISISNETQPSMTSLKQNVDFGTGVGYKVVMTENGLTPGRYVCLIIAKGPNPTDATVIEEWETKQIFLRVTT